ncbi:AAA family ATPase [Calidifontibacter sp. DB0510]|uniref:AAA family ATPase n=1 Tax=Metallococcus carri TaxID=1656884 RepID=A0A967B3C6_9MICO|nr:AAA family ATPase [Metallococcus carri]NHN56530.1 AAA family ATPase [Metallococcus carri]NOP38829.1 AAA family ATPase [Calidifontibacter sp. DB2511S]
MTAAARVLVLCGPSGSGKSRLADRLSRTHGWPTIRLDDFYKAGDDPSLPMTDFGVPDWDNARSWNLQSALDALRDLCLDGRAELPVYDIATSSVTGCHVVDRGDAPIVIAEGIFAAETIAGLRALDLLAAAYCIRQQRQLTMARRFVRDVRERRKPVPVLLRRGWHLMRLEPRIVAAHERLGARPSTPRAVERAATLWA